MSKMPSFLAEKTADLELGGRTLRFYAVSAPVLLKLQAALGAPLARLIVAIRSGQSFEVALPPLLEAIGANGELAATLILDALHEEPWVTRPVTKAAADEFLATVGGPALFAMLAVVVQVNTEAFGPLVVGLLTGPKASSPEAIANPSATSAETT